LRYHRHDENGGPLAGNRDFTSRYLIPPQPENLIYGERTDFGASTTASRHGDLADSRRRGG
jgi:hypothetical protein